MKHQYLAVDLGATSGRMVLGSFTDKGLSLKEVCRFPNHLIEVGGHFYWDLYALYRHIIEGLKTVAQSGETPASIGIDTWGVDFVCVGKDGNLLRQPFSYRDPHTEGAPERFFKQLPREELYARTGIQIMNFNTIFQLDTMRANADSALEAADKILFIPDALGYLLTGEMVTEYTIASTAQLLDVYKRRFDADLLRRVGLSTEHFGRFVYPGEQVGVLTEEVRRQTGLGAVPVIAVAGHDTASAVASVPATHGNFAYLSSGTWSLMGVETDTPVVTAETERLNFTNEGGVAGTIRLLKNICGMWLLERCRLKWGETDYAELIDEAGQCKPFSCFINPDDPCFANPSDMEAAIRNYCNETAQPLPQGRGGVVRCIFESLALRYRQVLDNLRTLSPHPVEVLHVIGGGSRNKLLNRFTANAIGMPVIAGPAEATAIGNVMLQAMAAGEASDVASMRRLVAASIPLQTYLPEHPAEWNAAYERFKTVVR